MDAHGDATFRPHFARNELSRKRVKSWHSRVGKSKFWISW
jgi:hypothetical protein